MTRNVDSGNATYSSGNLAVNLAGTYSWRAFYSGDDTNDNVSTACAAANSTSTVAKASPTMSATGGPGATLGQPITASGDLAAGVSPTGTITFRAYGPGDATCANVAAVEATVNVNAGNGNYASGNLTPNQAGAYRWRAFYSGDANNLVATSACNAAGTTTNVAKASPSVANDATDGAVGGAITDTATLSGGLGPSGPTGNLTFRAYGPADGTCVNSPAFSATVPVNSGNDDYGSGNFTTSAAGTYRWRIEYSGDANNEATTSACNAADSTSSVANAAPSLTTNATASATVGEPIADTATLAGGHAPTGTITFRVYGPDNATCAGSPAQTLTATVNAGNGNYGSGNYTTSQAGVYRWTAEYSGDANNNPASSACNAANEISTVGKETPALTTAASNGVHGGTISDTATLAGGHAPPARSPSAPSGRATRAAPALRPTRTSSPSTPGTATTAPATSRRPHLASTAGPLPIPATRITTLRGPPATRRTRPRPSTLPSPSTRTGRVKAASRRRPARSIADRTAPTTTRPGPWSR